MENQDTSNMTIESNQRIEYLDYLRVFATLAVVVLHVSAEKWHHVGVFSMEWRVFNFYDGLVRFSVPMFLMISGALFLAREIPLDKLYKKYVLRMVTAFFFWSVIYYLFNGAGVGKQFTGLFSGEFATRFASILDGKYHLWYVKMIIGLYITLPLIGPIVKNRKLIKYFLTIAMVSSFFITIGYFVSDFGNASAQRLMEAVQGCFDGMELAVSVGFTVFFVLGYFLSTTEISKKHRIILYVLGIFSFIAVPLVNKIASYHAATQIADYYDSFTLCVVMQAIAVFVFFQYKKIWFPKLYPFIRRLSEYSFGAFLVHLIIMERMDWFFGVHTLSFHPLLSVPVITVIVFTVSMLISWGLHQIPILKKYVV